MLNKNNKIALVLDADKVDVDEIDRKYNGYIGLTKSYFEKLSSWWWYCLGFDLLDIYVAATRNYWIAYSVGIMVLGLLVWGIRDFYQKQTDDATFDKVLNIVKKKISADANNKTGLTYSDFVREPLSLDVPDFVNSEVNDYKCGKDGKPRYAKHKLYLFFFTQKYLASYHAKLNLKTGTISGVQTEEFFYKDVVSVGVKNDGERFVLKNSAGDSINIQLKNAKSNGIIVSADNVANSIRALLRDLK